MSAPSIAPQSFYVQQGNQQVLLTWEYDVTSSPAVSSYQIQRSTDGLTFTNLVTPAINQYVDTTAVLGTSYYYRVASINADGTGPYTTPQNTVVTIQGEMSLGQIRLAAQQRADRVNSDFVTLPEWNQMINQSMYELYDLLITQYEDYFVAPALVFTTDGSTSLYPLPRGDNYSVNGSPSPAFYKLMGVDLGINNANNAYVTMDKFMFLDRNRFVYPNTSSTIYGVFNCQYRLVGDKIEFIPTPSANQPIRLWYYPKLTMLLLDSDVSSTSISGWIEYVIVDAAIKALQKEESDVSVLMVQKAALIKRIEETSMNRDQGRPDRISDVRQNGYYGGGYGGGFNGPIGGF